jgi:hypothetical protein
MERLDLIWLYDKTAKQKIFSLAELGIDSS